MTPLIDNKERARKNLRIVFLHFDSKKSCSRIAFGIAGTDLFGWQAPRSAATSRGQALANAAKFSAANAYPINQLKYKEYFSANFVHNWLLRAGPPQS